MQFYFLFLTAPEVAAQHSRRNIKMCPVIWVRGFSQTPRHRLRISTFINQ